MAAPCIHPAGLNVELIFMNTICHELLHTGILTILPVYWQGCINLPKQEGQQTAWSNIVQVPCYAWLLQAMQWGSHAWIEAA